MEAVFFGNDATATRVLRNLKTATAHCATARCALPAHTKPKHKIQNAMNVM
jgi:hypothetical protein